MRVVVVRRVPGEPLFIEQHGVQVGKTGLRVRAPHPPPHLVRKVVDAPLDFQWICVLELVQRYGHRRPQEGSGGLDRFRGEGRNLTREQFVRCGPARPGLGVADFTPPSE